LRLDVDGVSLSADWAAACNLMRQGLEIGAEKTLASLDVLRRNLLVSGGARMFLISSPTTEKAIAPHLDTLALSLALA
jgi:hypothetical protein